MRDDPEDLFDAESRFAFKNDLQEVVGQSTEPAALRLRRWVGRLHVHSMELSLMQGESTYPTTKNRLREMEVLIDCVLLSDMMRNFDKASRILKTASRLILPKTA